MLICARLAHCKLGKVHRAHGEPTHLPKGQIAGQWTTRPLWPSALLENVVLPFVAIITEFGGEKRPLAFVFKRKVDSHYGVTETLKVASAPRQSIKM